MELIVAAFVATALTLLGHLSLVIGHQFERPTRPLRFPPEAPTPPAPPPKRAAIPSATASQAGLSRSLARAAPVAQL